MYGNKRAKQLSPAQPRTTDEVREAEIKMPAGDFSANKNEQRESGLLASSGPQESYSAAVGIEYPIAAQVGPVDIRPRYSCVS